MPMQLSEILAYLDLAEVESNDERLKFARLMRQMDAVELKHLRKQMEKK